MKTKNRLKMYNICINKFNELNEEMNILNYQKDEVIKSIRNCESKEKKAIFATIISSLGIIITSIGQLPPVTIFSLCALTCIFTTIATSINVYSKKYERELDEINTDLSLSSEKIKKINKTIIDLIENNKKSSCQSLYSRENIDKNEMDNQIVPLVRKKNTRL